MSASAPYCPSLPTLEESLAHHARAMKVLSADPAAREFQELRRKWSKAYGQRNKLRARLEATESRERALFAQLEDAKALLSPEAREAIAG